MPSPPTTPPFHHHYLHFPSSRNVSSPFHSLLHPKNPGGPWLSKRFRETPTNQPRDAMPFQRYEFPPKQQQQLHFFCGPHIGHVCLNFYIGRVPSWVKIIKYCARRRRSSRSSSSSSISLSVRIHINTINPRLLLEWSTRSPGDLQRIPSSTHTRHAVSQQAPHHQSIDVVGFTVMPARSDASVWVWRISCQRGRAGDGGGKEELLVEVQTTALSLLFGQIGRYVVCVECLVGYNLN